ncbi:hypothetical protein A1O3_03166 [Capronia epimyces CBS 606.96]|uniref:DUF3669 domain-containing protein n=1 Tax=Capronia epimyces CBS 606.96 TaxID=1182542 RepID=W9YB59_9EURO|nr:uncharacterized protein A1O3_03166 [Capronia epimyces CBS 606.96]EXJ90097.1 hypothetical protein A1O3_03166 [Capronia epimyces CBS 606.96]
MSRRQQSRNDSSIDSITESLKSLMATGLRYAGDLSGLTFLDETFLREHGPEQVLHHMLSTKSYILTTSTLVEKNQDAYNHPEMKSFVKVGQGQCGTVWALTGTTMVLKVPNDGKKDQLYNDYCQHAAVEEAFRSTFSVFRRHINLPSCQTWLGPHNELFWKDHAKFLPKGFQSTYGIVSTRIFPVPLPVCSAIVDACAPRSVKNNKESFLAQPENKDCLIRIYLGRRQERSSMNAFRLRNFDMTVNEMEYSRLDTHLYAESMGHALAIMHWKAGVDGNDVEFVFGSSPEIRLRPTAAELACLTADQAERLSSELDFKHRSLGIWLLDFDQCQRFEEGPQGVKQLERAFYFNDPYYPRPASKDPKDRVLWTTFKDSYLEASAEFTDSKMPQQFIDAVEAEGIKRSSGRSLFG